MAQLRIVPCESWEQQAQVFGAWNELLAESAADTVFLTREWLTCWWGAYRGKRELLILLCIEGRSELVGVVPLYRARVRTDLRIPLDRLCLVGDGTFDSDHLDFITRPGYEARVVAAVLEWLNARRSMWDLLDLDSVPVGSPSLRAVAAELVDRGWSQSLVEEQQAVLELPTSWNDYLASLSSATRSSLRRKERDLYKRHDVRLRRCETVAELPLFLDQLYRLHGDRWQRRGQPGSFEYPGRRTFYDRLSRCFLALGWLNFWILDVDGDPVAAEYGFRHGATHSFLQGGFSPAHARESVGVVLKAHILRDLIGSGIRTYDFLNGTEAYKHRWGPSLVPHAHLRCAREGSLGAAFVETRKLVERTKTWLHQSIPSSVALPIRRQYRKLRPWRGGLEEAQTGSEP